MTEIEIVKESFMEIGAMLMKDEYNLSDVIVQIKYFVPDKRGGRYILVHYNILDGNVTDVFSDIILENDPYIKVLSEMLKNKKRKIAIKQIIESK